MLNEDVIPNDEAVINALKEEFMPRLHMYGATPDVAEKIWQKLADNEIETSFVIQDEYVPNKAYAAKTVMELPRISTERAEEYFKRKYSIILGYVGGYLKADEIKQRFTNAKAVYYLSEIFDMEMISQEFVRENRDAFESLCNSLCDQLSKDSLLAYLRSKIEQDMKYLPPVFERIQYFPKDIVELTEHESYFDCGAFNGDTVTDFLTAAGGKYRRIWAAEPDPKNFAKLQRYVDSTKPANIELINKGIYSEAGSVHFNNEGSMLSMIDEKAYNSIEVDTIDNIVGDAEVTFIKFDVEGAELEALKGAAQTIIRQRPLLAVSVYHRKRDLLDIPAYIHSLVPEYRFYFRAHKKLAIDTVLYCVRK